VYWFQVTVTNYETIILMQRLTYHLIVEISVVHVLRVATDLNAADDDVVDDFVLMRMSNINMWWRWWSSINKTSAFPLLLLPQDLVLLVVATLLEFSEAVSLTTNLLLFAPLDTALAKHKKQKYKKMYDLVALVSTLISKMLWRLIADDKRVESMRSPYLKRLIMGCLRRLLLPELKWFLIVSRFVFPMHDDFL